VQKKQNKEEETKNRASSLSPKYITNITFYVVKMSVLPFVRGVDFTKNDFSVSTTNKIRPQCCCFFGDGVRVRVLKEKKKKAKKQVTEKHTHENTQNLGH